MTNRRFSHTIEGVRGKVPREKGVVHFEKEPFARFFRQPVGIHSCLHRLCGRNGNIWMFPTRVSKFGGGSFLLAYFLFVFVIGFSGVIGEMAFGRATRSVRLALSRRRLPRAVKIRKSAPPSGLFRCSAHLRLPLAIRSSWAGFCAIWLPRSQERCSRPPISTDFPRCSAAPPRPSATTCTSF